MKLLRYLEPVELLKASNTKQSNGVAIKNFG